MADSKPELERTGIGQETSLLPPVEQLAVLSDATATAVIQACNQQSRREHSYAVAGLASGLISFLACVGSYTYLIETNHYTGAGVILGAGVLGVIGQFVKSRLSK